MANHKVIVGLDVGSSRIRTVIGTVEDKRSIINIIGVGSAPSSGIRRGMITDLDEAISNITASFDEAEMMSGEPIHSAYVSSSGSHIETYDSRGVIAINSPNAEIAEDDIDRVLDAARAVSLPANRDVLRTIPKSFTVDDQSNIKYPIGMTGIRLEVESHMITGQSAAIKNLEKCLYQTGIDIQEIVPSVLASAEAVLDRKQKELGVVLLEIGGDTTNIAVFAEGSIVCSAVIPVGGNHVTNDIAIGLRCGIETAEKIKIEYGTVLHESISDREEISLDQISRTDSHTVSKKQLSKIIEARYHEIFLLVHDELSKIGSDGMLPAGAVLVGSAIKTPGVIELARETLQLPVQLGTPADIEGIIDRVDDPGFACAVGLLHFGNRYGLESGLLDFSFLKSFDKTIRWLKGFMP